MRISVELGLPPEVLARRDARPIRVMRDTLEYRYILSLPSLSDRDRSRPQETRFDELGQIYVSRWNPTEVLSVGKRLRLGEPKKFLQLKRRGEHSVDLADLPKFAAERRGVSELVFGKVGESIETAIRQQKHILENYQPGTAARELEQVKMAVRYARIAGTKFLTEKITKATLEDSLDETSDFLRVSGFLSEGIRQPQKIKIRDMLLRAAQTDSLDRVNPLISLTRLRSAFNTGLKRAVAASMIVEKAEDNLRLLTWEREMTRWALEMAAEDLENLAGLAGKRPPVYFWKKGVPVYSADIIGMIRVLENIAGPAGLLAAPRVVPYNWAAKLAALNLLGVKATTDKKITREIVGGKTFSELVGRSPVPVLLKNQRFDEARRRIGWSHTIIQKVLSDYASIAKEKTA